MKAFIISFILTFTVIGLLASFNHPPKAWADLASTTQVAPVKGDLIQIVHNGVTQNINWQDLDGYVVKTVNWNCVTLTSGANTWGTGSTCYTGS